MSHGRQHQSSTATHAYVSAIPLVRPVRNTDSSADTTGSQRSQSSTGTTADGSQIKVQKKQQRRHQVQFESAYTFQAPSGDPLVGCSRQHMRIEKHVSGPMLSIWLRLMPRLVSATGLCPATSLATLHPVAAVAAVAMSPGTGKGMHGAATKCASYAAPCESKQARTCPMLHKQCCQQCWHRHGDAAACSCCQVVPNRY